MASAKAGGLVVVAGGDVFESGCSVLVNAVNCRGVMGAGIALQFKRRFPVMFEDYRRRCQAHDVRLGQPYLWRCEDAEGSGVLNFPTKDHWGERSALEPISAGLAQLRARYREWGIESLALPAIGCGLGGLCWSAVGPLLVEAMSGLGMRVVVCAPAAPTDC